MGKSSVNLQDSFLNQARREGRPLTVVLTGGAEYERPVGVARHTRTFDQHATLTGGPAHDLYVGVVVVLRARVVVDREEHIVTARESLRPAVRASAVVGIAHIDTTPSTAQTTLLPDIAGACWFPGSPSVRRVS